MSQLIFSIPSLYFSYSQFFIYDSTIATPGLLWSDAHERQGFARKESNVSFATLTEFGTATVNVFRDTYSDRPQYSVAIQVPFLCTSGRVKIGSVETFGADHHFHLEAGHYALTVAQILQNEEAEIIDVYLNRCAFPLERSNILKYGKDEKPPTELHEDAEYAV